MKKLITIGFASLISIAATGSRKAEITLLEEGINYMGFMPLDISSDGKYLCGSSFGGPLFVSEWQKQEYWVPQRQTAEGISYVNGEMRSITTSGFAIGLGPNVDYESRTMSYTMLGAPKLDVRGGLTDAISDDGKIITGLAYKNNDPLYYAAYWENGECHLLPVPSEEETGWKIYGSRARFISDDGSVIAGYMVDRLSTFPMIYWTRQDDGTYEMHPVFLDYFCDSRDNDKQYVRFCPYAMSPNGKYIVLQTKETHPSGYINNQNILALYDVETGEIINVNIDGTNGVPTDATLQVWDHGVANDGTIVGWYENRLGRVPFIITTEDMSNLQPLHFADAFPSLEGRFRYYDEAIGDDAASCISADGRYLSGCAWTLHPSGDYGYYDCYVIDRHIEDPETPGEIEDPEDPAESGIDIVKAIEEGAEFYTITGVRLQSPARGINIVRYPDGRSRKAVVRGN